ncbi:hypothetical protein DFH09DRAFT_560485 [Mycena vulgaris]|nr:hypothetical protein DFH09DRAFT_560485 [Mycena vulgaris]
MESCPNEILADIVEFLAEPDLFNLRLVGRRLRDLSTRSAFSRLVICDNISSVQRFYNLLTECDDSAILNGVEKVAFDGTCTDHFEMGAESTTELIETAFSLLYRLPNVRTLRLDFFPGSAPDKNEMYLTYYVEVQLAFWASLSRTPLPSLRTLHIGAMVTYFPRLLKEQTDPFLHVFRPLTSLSISVVSLFQARRLPNEIMLFNFNMLTMIMTAQNITSLELGADTLAGITSPFPFEDFRFPALTSFALNTILFAGLPDDDRLSSAEKGPSIFPDVSGQPLTVEMFILNHKATLQRIALHDCAIALPDGVWHRVFRRFRVQLPALVEFEWLTDDSEQRGNFLYARSVGALQTYTVVEEDFLSDDPQDVASLDDLQSAVLDRKNGRLF